MGLLKILLPVAWQSVVRRRTATWLTVLTVAVSTSVLISVEFARKQTQDNFRSTVSGIDLIVGPRTNPLHLLLYSVFQIGAPTNNVSAESYEFIDEHPRVAWTIPISLGDAWRGNAVIGTTQELFEHFHYAGGKNLAFAHGSPFSNKQQAVAGSDLPLKIGDEIVLAHGTGEVSFLEHKEEPVAISGVLEPTGTPLDRSIMVTLELMESIHSDPAHAASRGHQHKAHTDHDDHGDHDDHSDHGHHDDHDDHSDRAQHSDHSDHAHRASHAEAEHHDVTALLVGLKSKSMTFRLLRELNEYEHEPLTAILPGFTVAELWRLTRGFEVTLQFISVLVLLTTVIGISAILLTTLNGRRYELAVLRAIGAPHWFVLVQMQLEATITTLLGIVLAVLTVQGVLFVGQDWLMAKTGVAMDGQLLTLESILVLASILVLSNLAALLPSITAYRRSLSAGLHDA